MALIVQKYGGSSVADTESIKRVAKRVVETEKKGNKVAVVVSAMGDTTDDLIDQALSIDSNPPEREMDMLMTAGERISMSLLAMAIHAAGDRAHSFTGQQAGFFTDTRYGAAHIKAVKPDRVQNALSLGDVAIVAGFQGINAKGDATTLGRGGSDTTAVALAAALDAESCEIYTDVDGIYTADPRIVSGARRLEEIDFRDMLLLAGAGSQVLHDRSVALALANDVEIRLLSSFEPGRGSRVRLLADAERPDYAGVTRSEARSEITLAGRAAGTATLSELVIALSKSGIPVLSGSSGEGWVTVRVAPAQMIPALELTHTAYLRQRAE